jgi:hypothetical protein
MRTPIASSRRYVTTTLGLAISRGLPASGAVRPHQGIRTGGPLRGSRRFTRWLAVALAAALALPAAGGAARAHAARTISLSDSGRLHLTSHHGFTLNEQGSASGTISGTIYLHLTVVSTNRVTAEINIYPSGGSVTGKASASYHPSGAVATFSGTMSVVRGSGSYNHASGSGLSFTGTVQRSNDAITVHVSGKFST